MRKVIAVIIMIGLGALLIYNPSIYNRRNATDDEHLFDSRIEEDEILRLAKLDQGVLDLGVNKLQVAPEQLMNFNSMLMKVMYDPTTSEEDIEILTGIQRQYYHADLIALNPEVEHMKAVIQDVLRARESQDWIIAHKVESTIYDPNDTDVAIVTVSFTPNSVDSTDDIFMQYLLEREEVNNEKLWFIKGWIGIDESEVVVAE